MRRYIWKKQDGYSQPIGLTKLMGIAALKLLTGAGPFIIIQDGNPMTPPLSRREALSRLKQAVSNREIGSTFRVRRGDGNVVFTCRAVRIDTVKDSTNGNTNADRFYNWVMDRFGAYSPRYAGAYVCKYVADSTIRSQHAYGNAVDFFFDTLANQEAVALAATRDARELNIGMIISKQRDWTPNEGWTSYGGDYHSHLHVQFLPYYSGDCGIRE